MPWAYWGLAAPLPMIPDLDVFFSGTYGTALGHRGITHSLLFALALAMIAAAATFKIQRGTVPFLGNENGTGPISVKCTTVHITCFDLTGPVPFSVPQGCPLWGGRDGPFQRLQPSRIPGSTRKKGVE
jgi:hypothetical protein